LTEIRSLVNQSVELIDMKDADQQTHSFLIKVNFLIHSKYKVKLQISLLNTIHRMKNVNLRQMETVHVICGIAIMFECLVHHLIRMQKDNRYGPIFNLS